ncbi:hypothetical protein QLX55_02445 [Solobacterium moorei]|uniref:hypothetical protein n=1 Tax=Solobacterium moorei TaxID=102148 RepID=UPI0024AD6D5B|nr:hypothetical protein [Solobacterium moorei]MDI6414188.1 hypothetical protein [Solobacterium moorei]
MSIVIHSFSVILIVLVVSWLIYYARHKHDPMGNRIDVEKTYMLVGCLIGAVIGILCGMYLIDSVALGIGPGMLIGMMIGITVPKIKKKERTWQQK